MTEGVEQAPMVAALEARSEEIRAADRQA